MSARAAYISSVGTTTILVAASLLMLGVVSAFVAFHGWPGKASGESVTSVPLEAPRPASVQRQVSRAPAVATKRVASAGRAVGSSTATVGLVKQVGVSPTSTVGLLVKFSPPPTGTLSTPPAEPAPAAVAGPGPAAEAPSPPAAPVVPRPPSAPPEVQTVVDGLIGPLPVHDDGSVHVTLPGDAVELGIVLGDAPVAVRAR